MELLLAALAGAIGLAFLTQSKPVPSEDDYNKAKAKLDKDLTDPDANTTVGKYMAFVLGNYSGAMPYLVHSSDKTLKTLAEHELDDNNLTTAPQKVGMGDEWIAAAKNFKALSPAFYDRAAQWYIAAWPSLDGIWQDKARQQGRKLAVARPQGPARKGMPSGWQADVGRFGRPPVIDGNVAHTGSYSIKIPPADEKQQGSLSAMTSDLIPIPANAKAYEASAYILADGTENAGDKVLLRFFDANGTQFTATPSTFYPIDLPFWNRVSIKGDVPPNAVRAQIVVVLYSKKGSMWIDDVSLKFDGKESAKNTSFEEK